MASATSTSFRVDTVAAFCADDVACARSTSIGTTKLDVTALPAGASADAGFLTMSFNAGPSIDCAGYQEISADTALVDFASPNRTKQATLTFDKKAMTQSPNNGAAFLELCFGSPQPFLTKAGSGRPRRGASTGTATGRPSRSMPGCSQTPALMLRRA